MRDWATVGSFSESHRANRPRPDRRNFIPPTRRLLGEPPFPGPCPPLRGAAPKAPTPAPVFPQAAPNFPTTVPIAKTPAPIFWSAAPNFLMAAPMISVAAPIFPAPAPNFSPAALICNGLFPSHLWKKPVLSADCANFADFPNLICVIREICGFPASHSQLQLNPEN